MQPVKIVLDTNVYVMSFAKHGSFLDELIRNAVELQKITLYSSPEILHELEQTLEHKLGFDRSFVVDVLKDCRDSAKIVHPTQRISVVRDPDDNKILECAVEAGAAVIVSADKDLLSLKRYQTVQIIHPANLKYWLQPKKL